MGKDAKKGEHLTIEQKDRIWRGRARKFMTGVYATDESIEIYGLQIKYAENDRDYVDVFSVEQSNEDSEDLVYVDTVQIAQYTTVAQFLQQLRTYFPNKNDIPDEPEGDDKDEPSPTFQ